MFTFQPFFRNVAYLRHGDHTILKMMKKKTAGRTEASSVSDSAPHRYDRIWRENLRSALPGLIEKVLHIKVTASEVLADKLQIASQKETDGLWKVTDTEGNVFILHIEVQVSGNEPEMANRMATYRIMTRQIYRLPVKQLGNIRQSAGLE